MGRTASPNLVGRVSWPSASTDSVLLASGLGISAAGGPVAAPPRVWLPRFDLVCQPRGERANRGAQPLIPCRHWVLRNRWSRWHGDPRLSHAGRRYGRFASRTTTGRYDSMGGGLVVIAIRAAWMWRAWSTMCADGGELRGSNGGPHMVHAADRLARRRHWALGEAVLIATSSARVSVS